MIKPPVLNEGDCIAIISPSSSEESERFDRSTEQLTSMGYKVIEGEHARDSINYFAGLDEHRAADINCFLHDNSVRALFASRGGYGCSRLLGSIDYEALKKDPKIILGGSDLTALLWAIQQKTGLVTFFGPMALQIGSKIDKFSKGMLWRALNGKLSGGFSLPPDYYPYSIHSGKARGKLIGGCLALVVSLLGTEYFGDVEGRILFLEDVGEKPFRIDRMLTQLRNAGVFEKISGLVLGEFYQCWEGEYDSFTLEEIIRQLIPAGKMPVLAGMPFGHGAAKMTLPLGVEVELDTDARTLVFLEEGVEK